MQMSPSFVFFCPPCTPRMDDFGLSSQEEERDRKRNHFLALMVYSRGGMHCLSFFGGFFSSLPLRLLRIPPPFDLCASVDLARNAYPSEIFKLVVIPLYIIKESIVYYSWKSWNLLFFSPPPSSRPPRLAFRRRIKSSPDFRQPSVFCFSRCIKPKAQKPAPEDQLVSPQSSPDREADERGAGDKEESHVNV